MLGVGGCVSAEVWPLPRDRGATEQSRWRGETRVGSSDRYRNAQWAVSQGTHRLPFLFFLIISCLCLRSSQRCCRLRAGVVTRLSVRSQKKIKCCFRESPDTGDTFTPSASSLSVRGGRGGIMGQQNRGQICLKPLSADIQRFSVLLRVEPPNTRAENSPLG